MAEVTGHSFELPWPPSLNRYYRHVGPRVLISREGRKYRRMVVSRLAGLRKLDGRLKLYGEFYPPDNRRRDLDNVGSKIIEDALMAAGLFEDDSCIKEIHIKMLSPIPPDGLIHIELTQLDAEKENDDVRTEELPEGGSPSRI